MTGNELEALDTFLHGLLAADAALTTLLGGSGKVWQEIAAQSAAEPLVVTAFLSSPDVNVVGADSRAFTRPLMQVRAVSIIGFGQIAPVADRIDQLLMGARGSVPASNLSIMGGFREEPVRSVEVDGAGVTYYWLGGRYRFFCSGITG